MCVTCATDGTADETPPTENKNKGGNPRRRCPACQKRKKNGRCDGTWEFCHKKKDEAAPRRASTRRASSRSTFAFDADLRSHAAECEKSRAKKARQAKQSEAKKVRLLNEQTAKIARLRPAARAALLTGVPTINGTYSCIKNKSTARTKRSRIMR